MPTPQETSTVLACLLLLLNTSSGYTEKTRLTVQWQDISKVSFFAATCDISLRKIKVKPPFNEKTMAVWFTQM